MDRPGRDTLGGALDPDRPERNRNVIAQVLTDYQLRCDQAPIDKYPLLWFGHYSDRMLGQYGSHDYPEAKLAGLVLSLMAPFGVCDEVQRSWVVIDGAHVKPYQRTLFISGLYVTEKGIGTVHYVADYRIGDRGNEISEPRKEFYLAPRVHDALSVITDRRLEPVKHGWDETYIACLNHMEEIL